MPAPAAADADIALLEDGIKRLCRNDRRSIFANLDSQRHIHRSVESEPRSRSRKLSSKEDRLDKKIWITSALTSDGGAGGREPMDFTWSHQLSSQRESALQQARRLQEEEMTRQREIFIKSLSVNVLSDKHWDDIKASYRKASFLVADDGISGSSADGSLLFKAHSFPLMPDNMKPIEPRLPLIKPHSFPSYYAVPGFDFEHSKAELTALGKNKRRGIPKAHKRKRHMADADAEVIADDTVSSFWTGPIRQILDLDTSSKENCQDDVPSLSEDFNPADGYDADIE